MCNFTSIKMSLAALLITGMAGIQTLAAQNAPAPTAATKQDNELANLRKAAQAGDANAMNRLGCRYHFGNGVEKNLDEAIKCYRLAAQAGDAAGMCNLGFMYEQGLTVDKDQAEALKWYRRAADAGDAVGMNQVGLAYHLGLNTEKDFAQAMTWYLKAAQAGNTAAMSNIAYMYEHGEGVDKDQAKANTWNRKAAESQPLPKAAKTTFLSAFPKGEIATVNEEIKDVFRIKFNEKGKACETVILADGTCLGKILALTAEETPADVLRKIRQAAPGAQIAGIEKVEAVAEVNDGILTRFEKPAIAFRAEVTKGNSHGRITLDDHNNVTTCWQ